MLIVNHAHCFEISLFNRGLIFDLQKELHPSCSSSWEEREELLHTEPQPLFLTGNFCSFYLWRGWEIEQFCRYHDTKMKWVCHVWPSLYLKLRYLLDLVSQYTLPIQNHVTHITHTQYTYGIYVYVCIIYLYIICVFLYIIYVSCIHIYHKIHV